MSVVSLYAKICTPCQQQHLSPLEVVAVAFRVPSLTFLKKETKRVARRDVINRLLFVLPSEAGSEFVALNVAKMFVSLSDPGSCIVLSHGRNRREGVS